MKIYEDEACTKPLDFIDFGEVYAGESKEVIIYVKNDSDKAILKEFTIKYILPKEKPNLLGEKLDVKFPERVLPNSIELVALSWFPSLNFKDALQIEIEIEAKESYSPTR